MRQAGKLIASGRDSDIYECGPGLVLRRSRRDRSMATEAKTMDYARGHGYPVPAVEEISNDGLQLVMERIDGPSMVELVGRKPWMVRRQGKILADLHRRLHEIPAPDWLPAAPCGDGEQLLHLDLHPLNVIIGPNGPVVIDWPNAARGDGGVDVALAWVLMACGQIPFGRVKAAVLGQGRALLVKAFLHGSDLPGAKGRIRCVVDWKVKDANMSDAERAAMRRLAQRN